MVNTTRKSYKRKEITIPYLRRSFEYVEQFIANKIANREKKDKIMKDLQKIWKETFYMELNKKHAEVYLDQIMKKSLPAMSRKKHKGGLSGAPIDYSLHPGEYLEQGTIPHNGHLHTMDGKGYGSYIDYVYKGFTNPMIGQSYDPVPGQSVFPGQQGGRRKSKGRKIRKIRKSVGGMGAFLEQAFMRPIPSSVPSSMLNDAQNYIHGVDISGNSPDQIQRQIHYKS